MSAMIELNDRGNPKLTKHGLSVPEFKRLKEADHSGEKEKFENQITYIYFVFDKESPYIKIIPLRERIKTVLSDRIKGYTAKQFHEDNNVLTCIKKLEYLQYTIKERVLNQCELKFGEFQTLWSETSVAEETYEGLSAEFTKANGLFAVYEKLKKQVKEEKEVIAKNYGGIEPTLLEKGLLKAN